MARISVKFNCGDDVRTRHTIPTQGIVTAIFIRGKNRAYEISYTGEGGPTNTVCEEVELEAIKKKDSKIGF